MVWDRYDGAQTTQADLPDCCQDIRARPRGPPKVLSPDFFRFASKCIEVLRWLAGRADMFPEVPSSVCSEPMILRRCAKMTTFLRSGRTTPCSIRIGSDPKWAIYDTVRRPGLVVTIMSIPVCVKE